MIRGSQTFSHCYCMLNRVAEKPALVVGHFRRLFQQGFSKQFGLPGSFDLYGFTRLV